MHLAVGEGFGSFDEIAVVHPELSRHENAQLSTARSVYGDTRRRPNWFAILVILLVHAAALTLLATLDVIALPKPRHEAMVVTLIPDLAPPPSKPKPIPAVQPPPTAIDVPPPVVALVQPTPNIVSVPPPVAQPQPTPAPAPAPAKTVSVDLDAATADGPSPVYPMESRRRHEQGTVRLRVVITPEGRVKDVTVASSSGFERLDKAALDAVRHWRFTPQMQGGVAVDAVGTLPIPFRLA
jgi:protein TonB